MEVLKVFFYYADRKPTFKNKRKIRHFIQKIFEYEAVNLNGVNYVFCSDKFLLKINEKFLKHSYYTDVITFNLSNSVNLINAEIYVSVDRIRDNAEVLQTDFINELLRVLFHGALHLCGYDDKDVKNSKKMRQKENYYLQMFHVKQSKTK